MALKKIGAATAAAALALTLTACAGGSGSTDLSNLKIGIKFDQPGLGLKSGDRVIALVNGMGGTPESELYIVYRKLAQLLAADGNEAARPMVGNYVTSLEMPGVSITLTRVDDAMLGYFDAPVDTPAWKN